MLAELDVAPPPKTSDGELSLLEARAETLSALPEADSRGTALAWRELGGALCDFSADREGALRAWERAASLDPERGVEKFAADVVAFIGFDAALERLRELAQKKREPDDVARVLAVAASLALESGRRAEAFETALRALALDPRAPTCWPSPSARRRFGRRGARSALRRPRASGARDVRRARGSLPRRAPARAPRRAGRALRHAVLAFEAVPSEGVVFVTMARLADRAGERAEVVRAIERVALANHGADARAGWLRRAALFTGSSEEGRRQRVDVLLRALSVRAEADLVRARSRHGGADRGRARGARGARAALRPGRG